MNHQFPLLWQVGLCTATAALLMLAVVVAHVLLNFKVQMNRIVGATEKFERELTPFLRESRETVARVGSLSAQARHQLVAVENLGGALLAPLRLANQATRVLRTGASVFLRAWWTGRRAPASSTSASQAR